MNDLTNSLDSLAHYIAQPSADFDEDAGPLHRSLNMPGFSQSTAAQAELLCSQFPGLNSLSVKYDETYIVQCLERDPQLGAYTDMYRRISAADPDMAAEYSYRGVSVAKAAALADAENARLAAALAPHLPAYLVKRAGDAQSCYVLTTAQALYAVLNNALYDTFKSFGYREPENTLEETFVNTLLSYGSSLPIAFPTLDAVVQPDGCGQLYFAATTQAALDQLLRAVAPVGRVVEVVYD